MSVSSNPPDKPTSTFSGNSSIPPYVCREEMFPALLLKLTLLPRTRLGGDLSDRDTCVENRVLCISVFLRMCTSSNILERNKWEDNASNSPLEPKLSVSVPDTVSSVNTFLKLETNIERSFSTKLFNTETA
ncbi:wsv015 [White spot syndrome virus]|uniref:Wsv015 n=4 Tax=White spot syndrome virus TaxID=342409 RepID=Q8VBE6_WSSVS|nr:wsv015 [Shrimp white spot syndrome virus]AFX59392.1 wsv015 [White spot syndrome virus]AAL33019.1 wsv015 [Shrimp white spot syndrome virus]AAL88939.1 WSSV071 [Shrimp white spot syndrome virus]AWQ60205.1 wsv015 [Shrimp white spot syndrome virus]AWQ60625.1 wsv015 [Shrimp white spot syndrome virus]